jgi:uncharacterized membrane protein
MTETSGGPASDVPVNDPGEARHSGLKTTAIICYVLYLIGFINGLTAIIGVILAYIKRPDARGTVWESHFRNLIVVFWVMLAVLALALVTLPASLFSLAALFDSNFDWPALSALALPMLAWIFLLPVFVIWFLYRMIRGLIRAADDSDY